MPFRRLADASLKRSWRQYGARPIAEDNFRRCAMAPHIDFLSVDVEGAEIDVLSGFLFERYRPNLILLADFANDLSRHRFRRTKNYKRVRRTGDNSWYVPIEATFPFSMFGRFQRLRKYTFRCLCEPSSAG